MSVEAESIESIGSFAVTDRGIESVEQIFGLNEQNIESLPPQAIVLNIGSGVTKRLEKDLNKLRPDLRFVSLDPSTGVIVDSEKRAGFLIGGDLDTEDPYLLYQHASRLKRSNDIENKRKASETLQEERFKKLKETPGSIAAFASHIPLKTESIDVAIDLMGAAAYIDQDAQEHYLNEIMRVLKSGGCLYTNILPQHKAYEDLLKRGFLREELAGSNEEGNGYKIIKN